MSQAFVKEDANGPEVLPDLPLSLLPNWVTPTGLAALRTRLARRQDDLEALRARPDRLDRLPEAAAERDIRYLEARLASAILVEPVETPEAVAFGVTVEVEDDGGKRRRYRIVGEDEADAGRGWITAQAPLARALIGLRPGDEAEWRGGALLVIALAQA